MLIGGRVSQLEMNACSKSLSATFLDRIIDVHYFKSQYCDPHASLYYFQVYIEVGVRIREMGRLTIE